MRLKHKPTLPAEGPSHGRVTAALMLVAALGGLPLAAGGQTTPAAAPAPAPAVSGAESTARSVRLEVGVPLQAAQNLSGEGKHAEALAKLGEAGAVPQLTPWETWVLERSRASIAQRAGNAALTLQALDLALVTGQAELAEELSLIEALVNIALRESDTARVLRWSERYEALKGTNDGVRVMRIQALADSGDEAGAKKAMGERVEAAAKAGVAVPESHLRLLLSLQYRSKDAGSSATLERLVQSYPRPEYFVDLVSAASRLPHLSDRALLELYRLLRATGSALSADMRLEMAQLAQRAGQPVEAQALLDEGYANGSLGAGAGAAEQGRQRDSARRAAAADLADRPAADAAARRAPDGTALADLGFAMVSAQPPGAPASAIEPGLALIEQGVAKGSLKRANEARLHLAMVQLAAGKKDAARQTLSALSAQAANDPLMQAIRLWTLYVQAPAMLPSRQ